MPLGLQSSKTFQETIDRRYAGFAYVNDPALGFAIRHVYVDVTKECNALRCHGFTICATIGNTKQTGGYDADDTWVYIVAKRG